MRHERQIGRQRQRRGFRVRNRLKRDATRPRLSVFRSHKNFERADYRRRRGPDAGGRQHPGQSNCGTKLRYGGNKTAAAEVGKAIAAKALEAGIKEVVFDRREYKYHGRVAALADAAREAGLKF